jgi:hypothetical protein
VTRFPDSGVQKREGLIKSLRQEYRKGGNELKRSYLYPALVVIVAAVALGGWACTPAKTTTTKKSNAETPYNLEEEGEIPPKDVQDTPAEADFEEIPMENDDVEGENVEAPKDTTKTGKSGAGPAGVAGKDGGFAIPVFRVQVLATSSEQSAMDAKKRVEKRLGFPAYVSLVDGMYKVRVGDCTTREEANKVRERCRGAGYSDAWIVTDVMKGQ